MRETILEVGLVLPPCPALSTWSFIMRQACFTFLLVLLMSSLSFGQTWDEARATMAENIRICEMILANPGKYPGINISTISTFHYYYINVPTVQTNLSVLEDVL
jgi:hypothetical protein